MVTAGRGPLRSRSARVRCGHVSLYGVLGSSTSPERIDARNAGELSQWLALAGFPGTGRSSRGSYRDIWPILYRPDQFRCFPMCWDSPTIRTTSRIAALFDPYKLCNRPAISVTGRTGPSDGGKAERVSAPRQRRLASLGRLAANNGPDPTASRPQRPLRRVCAFPVRAPEACRARRMNSSSGTGSAAGCTICR